MSKRILILITIVTLSLSTVLTGCSKDFLEEPAPTTFIPGSVVYGSDAGVRAFFSGIYRNLRTQWGTSTDAWGIASVNIAREVKGVDVVLPASNWYTFDYEHDNREPTYRRTTFTWNYFYQLVNQTNNVIEGVEGSELSQGSKDAFIAEGKALRAWAYFELVREYANSYLSNPQGKGIPLYLTSTTLETRGNPRATVAEVYTQIVKDLEEAVPKLPTARSLKDVINRNVGNGLLARVHLEMGNWEKARDAAVAARTGLNLSAAEYSTPFNSINKTEVMWGFPQSADQTIYYGTPSAFWGLSSATPGYYNFYIDSLFVKEFALTDVRRSTFYATGATDFTRWKSSKFGNRTEFTDHIPMMRVSEMYLIEAEARAELDDATAGTVLLTLQKLRDPNAVASGKTGDALVDEILLERRKELYGEIGIGFLDAKRRGLPLIRSVGHPQVWRVNIPANDPKFSLKIPQAEIDANEALTEADQNP